MWQQTTDHNFRGANFLILEAYKRYLWSEKWKKERRKKKKKKKKKKKLVKNFKGFIWDAS